MDDAYATLVAFLQERMDIDPAKISRQSTLEELNIDSLMLMELLFEFEEKLGIDLNELKESPKTIDELLQLVSRFQGAKP